MEEDKKISKYNEAERQIDRLDILWRRIEKVVEHGSSDLIAWKFYLDSVWRELYADVCLQSNKKKLIDENNDLKEKISKTPQNKLYDVLDERHLFLKKLQNDVGKGGTYEDENTEEAE